MPTEGSAVEEGTGSWQHSGRRSARHVRTGRRRFPQDRSSAGNSGTVTRVGRRDFGHSAVRHGGLTLSDFAQCAGVVGIKCLCQSGG